jgi:hypothetical protein
MNWWTPIKISLTPRHMHVRSDSTVLASYDQFPRIGRATKKFFDDLTLIADKSSLADAFLLQAEELNVVFR